MASALSFIDSDTVNNLIGDATKSISGSGDAGSGASSAEASGAGEGSVKGRRRLEETKLNADALGNVYESKTTEASTASFEWLYTVFKGGQNVVMLAEVGVDGE